MLFLERLQKFYIDHRKRMVKRWTNWRIAGTDRQYLTMITIHFSRIVAAAYARRRFPHMWQEANVAVQCLPFLVHRKKENTSIRSVSLTISVE
ncbi:hypothetical protein DICVIV_08070 [Dictyocaulus viviparus]|uniref:Uncharacterized protein n=1 Tax=Dictyocaulus viviparus TaxID=29172 RepID=A0A0D8XU26_DICVI|nr:hypothetical protein DICVIV_08070 [Dictyocaulus viviparus]